MREEAERAAALNPKPGLNAGLPFVCDAPGCGKRFAEKRSLAKHVKTHDTDRPYKCLFAGCESMGFLDSSKLKRHWLTHPGCWAFDSHVPLSEVRPSFRRRRGEGVAHG